MYVLKDMCMLAWMPQKNCVCLRMKCECVFAGIYLCFMFVYVFEYFSFLGYVCYFLCALRIHANSQRAYKHAL